nr:hypothetical protein [Desulforamulus aquiferis]
MDSAEDFKLTGQSNYIMPDGGIWLIMLATTTLPNNKPENLFDKIIATGKQIERFQTVVQFEVKTRAPDINNDFNWNTAMRIRDKLYDALAGPERNGLVIPRYDWANPDNPVQSGEIWFEINPLTSPAEEQVAYPDDPANKSIFLTYNMHWWKPTTVQAVAPNDPWLEALALWTEKELGKDWTIIHNVYTEEFQRPAIIWNLVNINAKQITASTFEVSKKFKGKVLGHLPNQQISGCLAIVEGLTRDIKIPLAGSQYLTVINPQTSIRKDSLVNGQVTVSLSRKTNRLTEEMPLMMKIDIEGSWQ